MNFIFFLLACLIVQVFATDEEPSCSICFEKFTISSGGKAPFECGHLYHRKCIKKWKKFQKKKAEVYNCPYCRNCNVVHHNRRPGSFYEIFGLCKRALNRVINQPDLLFVENDAALLKENLSAGNVSNALKLCKNLNSNYWSLQLTDEIVKSLSESLIVTVESSVQDNIELSGCLLEIGANPNYGSGLVVRTAIRHLNEPALELLLKKHGRIPSTASTDILALIKTSPKEKYFDIASMVQFLIRSNQFSAFVDDHAIIIAAASVNAVPILTMLPRYYSRKISQKRRALFQSMRFDVFPVVSKYMDFENLLSTHDLKEDFLSCVRNGQADCVKNLIKFGFPFKFDNGISLNLAMEMEHGRVARILLNNGINPFKLKPSLRGKKFKEILGRPFWKFVLDYFWPFSRKPEKVKVLNFSNKNT